MSTSTNDNWDFDKPWEITDPAGRAAFMRHSNLQYQREEKAASPLSTITDLGIALTPDEERDVRAFAGKMGVSFERVAEEMAATYTIIPDRTNTKLYVSLVKRAAMPRNLLAECMKGRIYMKAMRRLGKDQAQV